MPSSIRLPLSAAYIDPAFLACLHGAIEARELVEQFDRLYGATLVSRASPIEEAVDRATGRAEADMRAFVEFVHEHIYLRLPDEAIEDLRATSAVSNSPLSGSRVAAVCMTSDSVHRHHAALRQPPAPQHQQPLVCDLDVVVAGVHAERVVGQIGGAFKQPVCGDLVHDDTMRLGSGYFNSHFPSPDSFVYGATVGHGSTD